MKIKHDPTQVTPGKVLLILMLAAALIYLVIPQSRSSSGLKLVPPSEAVTDDQPAAEADYVKMLTRLERKWIRLPAALGASHNAFAAVSEVAQPGSEADSVVKRTPEQIAQQHRFDEELSARREAEEAARLAREEAQILQQRIEELHLNQVDAILQSAEGMTAIIGARQIREGQLLAGDVRVIRITQNGIRVKLERGEAQ